MTTMVVTSTINRKYLKNKTKDEIIDLLLWILDTRCEADVKIEQLELQITRFKETLRLRGCSCGWVGREFQTLDYKHEIGARLCPECHEPTEILEDDE